MKNEKYWESDDVQEIAAELIPKHHPHLEKARIAYMFLDKARKSGNFVVLGTARKTREIDKKLHGFDFIIVIANDTWERLDGKKKTILVDHELSHCFYSLTKEGDIRWKVVDHDIKNFRAIIERYGLKEVDNIEEMNEEKEKCENIR